jgi:uncharacterized protein (DUF427 family)
MPTARYNDTVIARSEDTVVVEGNHYFPREALVQAHFEPSDHTSFCPWKGTAHYFHVRVGDQLNENAAWTYPDPREAAKQIAGRVAFWRGVEVG